MHRPRVLRLALSLPAVVIATGACHSKPATATPPRAGSGALAAGRRAGASTQRTADCREHCREAWSSQRAQLGERGRSEEHFAYGCFSTCIDEVSRRLGVQCYSVFGAASPDEWQELYLARGLIEQSAFCIREAGDHGEPAEALLSALAVEGRTEAARSARQAEREALLSGDPHISAEARAARRLANTTLQWQRVVAAFQEWSAPPELAEKLISCMELAPLLACGMSADADP